MADENGARGKSNGPSHHAFSVREGSDGKSYFNRVGSAFVHKDGKGFNVNLDSVPVDGRVVLRTPKDRLKDMKAGEGKGRSDPSRGRE